MLNLFPRENLVGGSRRLPNLAEIMSPTVQSIGDMPDNSNGDDDLDGGDLVDGAADGGAAAITANCTKAKGDVMSAATWWRHPL